MNVTDPVADYLTRVRNAQKARHKHVDIPASKLKRAISQILVDKGYIRRFIDIEDGKQGVLRLYLKYSKGGEPTIQSLKRVSKPGLRTYVGASDLPRVLNGLGIAIMSTSRGVMTDKEARQINVGGEVLAFIY
ncbi:MAG: 30S ribosomal protein S8 [Bacteroidota bacterium]